MRRREFLGLAAALTVNPFSMISKSFGAKHHEMFGWIPNKGGPGPSLYQVSDLKGYATADKALLWKPWEKVLGKSWVLRSQLGPDCVANATASVVDLLTAIQIYLRNRAHSYVANSSSDMIYSGCRNIIGVELSGYKPSAGAMGEWSALYLQRYGNLVMQQYGDIDLSIYTKESLNYWDDKGVPNHLLEIAKEHPLVSAVKINNWSEARDALASGNPIVFTGLLSFSNTVRDNQGFCVPDGLRWPHAWTLAGYRDDRPGGLLINSWGQWASGPKALDQPDGSIWVDAEHLDNMMSRFNDSYAYSSYRGFQRPEKDYKLW